MRAKAPVPRTVVTAIAGWDPSGCAGLAADLRTLHHLGCHGQGVVTALTAQSATAVHGWTPVSPSHVTAQLSPLLQDPGPDAIKIGMLGSPEVARALTKALHTNRAPVVLDPILWSSTGASLFKGTPTDLESLCTRASLVTPNRLEAQWLLDGEAASAWSARLGTALLITHGGDDELFLPDGERFAMVAPRVAQADPAGTGCTLSTAIAAKLSTMDLVGAVRAGVLYTAAQVALVGPGTRQPLLHRDG